MNAGKNKGSLVSIGIPSIFLIFTVLTMSILAVLTFMVSRTDQAESALALEQTQAYYAACSRAADVITLFQKAWNEEIWFPIRLVPTPSANKRTISTKSRIWIKPVRNVKYSPSPISRTIRM